MLGTEPLIDSQVGPQKIYSVATGSIKKVTTLDGIDTKNKSVINFNFCYRILYIISMYYQCLSMNNKLWNEIIDLKDYYYNKTIKRILSINLLRYINNLC
jgi:hypothetical protein